MTPFQSYRQWYHNEHCPYGSCRNPKCDNPVGRDDWMLCSSCRERYPQVLARMEDALRERIREGLRISAKRALEQLPRWHQERTFEALRGCLSKSLLPIADRYVMQSSSMLVCGPSGDGKTAAVAAAVKRIAAKVTDDKFNVEPDDIWTLGDLKWCSGHELVKARREAPLGHGEAEPIIKAKEAWSLVIDELGQEPASEVPFEIIDHRYQNGLKTVVTSGLRPPEFKKRYGEACWRRLTEGGVGCLFSTFGKGET